MWNHKTEIAEPRESYDFVVNCNILSKLYPFRQSKFQDYMNVSTLIPQVFHSVHPSTGQILQSATCSDKPTGKWKNEQLLKTLIEYGGTIKDDSLPCSAISDQTIGGNFTAWIALNSITDRVMGIGVTKSHPFLYLFLKSLQSDLLSAELPIDFGFMRNLGICKFFYV
jgi:hypothetical protein